MNFEFKNESKKINKKIYRYLSSINENDETFSIQLLQNSMYSNKKNIQNNFTIFKIPCYTIFLNAKKKQFDFVLEKFEQNQNEYLKKIHLCDKLIISKDEMIHLLLKNVEHNESKIQYKKLDLFGYYF